jgi:hypothetical protein
MKTLRAMSCLLLVAAVALAKQSPAHPKNEKTRLRENSQQQHRRAVGKAGKGGPSDPYVEKPNQVQSDSQI